MTGDAEAMRHLRTLGELGAVGQRTDGQLLARLVADGSPAAFAALVERHGPMVLRVARQVLADPHDADDAFQATFLVLARSARSVRNRDSLASWLHGVALRVARRARRDAARRRAREREASAMSRIDHNSPSADPWPELHDEIARLPVAYRDAVVLCHLQGLTAEAAAIRLNCPRGTVLSRLARARERLRDRLTRRGLAPTAALIAAGLWPESAPAALSPAFADATVRAATAGNAPAAVLNLTGGVLRSMWISRCLKIGTAVTFAGLLAGGVGLAAGGRADDPPAIRPTPAAKPAPDPAPRATPLFALQIAADTEHDAEAAAAVGRDPEHPPEGYRWIAIDEHSTIARDGLILGPGEGPDVADRMLVKVGPDDVTDRALAAVSWSKDERDGRGIGFRLTPEGARHLGALTRSHLPDDRGRHRLAVIAEGAAVSTPLINDEVRESGFLDPGRTPAAEVDRLFRLLSRAAEANAPPGAKAVADQATALREARAVDLPALARADRVVIEKGGDRIILRVPRSVAEIRDALTVADVPPSAGKRAATLWFYRNDELIRRVWVYEGGEWGVVRQGTSWTTGRSARLWELVRGRDGP